LSKVIRTARFAGPSVTVGEAERDLYVGSEEKKEKGVESLGLAAMLKEDVNETEKKLNVAWENKMQQEVSYVRSEGDKKLQEAEQAWQGERETLHQQRYEEGLAEGLAQREAEATDAVRRMEVLHQSLVAERVQVLVEAEVAVVDLAVALARRIIGVQAVSNPKALIQVVRTALAHLSERSNLEIKVHPDDLAVARRFAAHWVEKVDQDAVFKVRSSAHVGRGGCMIEGLEENVDARLDEQLKIMHETLRDAVLGQAHEEREKVLAEVEEEQHDK
jgi:flagellar assembly protein FliH